MRNKRKNLSVRMTEEQHDRLLRYLSITRLSVSAYFRFLIAQRPIQSRPVKELNPYPGVNMIDSNVRQIARCKRARELDADAVEKLELLSKKLCYEAYLLSTRQ